MQLFPNHWIDAVLPTAALCMRNKMHIAAIVTVTVIKVLESGIIHKACAYRCQSLPLAVLYDSIVFVNVPTYNLSDCSRLQCGVCCISHVPNTMLTFAIAQAPLCSAGCICPCRGSLASFKPLVGRGSLSTASGLVTGLPLPAIKFTLEFQTI